MKTLKRAELSINVIVIAAICLLVLAVLVVIFTTKMGDFVFGIKNCEAQGGACKSSCAAGEAYLIKTSCDKNTNSLTKCCKAIET